jgi:hypothetical protein
VSSVVLPWVEIKAYLATVGPGVGRPPRPELCPKCDASRIWFDGWRIVHAIVLADGRSHRVDQGLPLQRVACSRCDASWTLRPPFLYPHRAFEPDVNEVTALSYLADPTATYVKVAIAFGCSARSIWRWVGWIAALAEPAALVAAAARIAPAMPGASLIPRFVPQAHAKARSVRRYAVLLCALQVLTGLAVYARAQVVPPEDPSPLRWWLVAQFLAFRSIAFVTGQGFSPPLPDQTRGPPR